MLIGIGTKIFGIASIGLLCSTLWFYAQYNAQVASNEVLISNSHKLEITIQTQNATIASLQEDQKNLSKSISTLTDNNNNLNSEMSEALTEVNTLRSTLLQRSLDNPFAVSNMNTQRWQDRKNSIVGGTNEQDN
jgi:peptidoglycan hydrolase CwlO-like protein